MNFYEVNKIVVSGNLTADGKMGYTQSGGKGKLEFVRI